MWLFSFFDGKLRFEIVYQFRLLIIISCDINIVTAVAGGEAGQIGLQKESQEFEKHEYVESGLIKDANVSIRRKRFKKGLKQN